MRSSTLRVFGAGPETFGIFGFDAMSRSPADGATFVAVGAGVVAAGVLACVLACCSAVSANLSAALSFVLSPHAVIRSAVPASAAMIRIFFIVSLGPPRALLPAPRPVRRRRPDGQGYEVPCRAASPEAAVRAGTPPIGRSRPFSDLHVPGTPRTGMRAQGLRLGRSRGHGAVRRRLLHDRARNDETPRLNGGF